MELRTKGLAAAIFIAALGLLIVLGATSFDDSAQASHGGMDIMSIDMDTTGNTSTSVDATPESCRQITKNNAKDPFEDVVDGLIIDVTAESIPAFDDKGTPSTADDSGGIVGYQYTLNYPPTQFTVSGQEATTPAVNILASNAGSAVSNFSEPVPDDNATTTWSSYAIDTADPSVSPPESGNGVLDRLTITADSSVTTGQYLISLSGNVHVDAGGGTYFPHTTTVANIAVGQACGALVTSYGYYHPLTPARILDTIVSGTITADVTGVGGVPNTSEVSAVVLNTTVDGPSSFSYLTVFPSGEPRPIASNLNFRPGQTVPNLVTVKVGADGNVQIYNNNGQARVIFDVVGWYGGPTGGSRFNPLAPSRILDTRTSPQGVPAGKVQSGSEITVTATGVGGVPPLASGVTAVVLNATVDAPTATSYLTVYPTGVTRPLASNLNFVKDQTVPNLVMVKVGAADGKVKVYNNNGQVDVIFDVVGWYGGSTGDVFKPLTPARILDTRTSPQGVPAGKVQTDADVTVAATGVGGVPWPGVSSEIVNVTVDQPTATSYLTIYPADAPRPTASNLNFGASQTIPNLVVVKVSAADGKVKAYNNNGRVDVIFDVVGYFGPVP